MEYYEVDDYDGCEYSEGEYDEDYMPVIHESRLQVQADPFVEDPSRLLNLEAEIKKKIIGQDAAITAVCRAIRRSRVGFKDPARPVGSFVFLGPSGVGKTGLCRVLAEVLYGDKRKLLKLDMSECMEKHEVSKLTGAAPGYTGCDKGGSLTNMIKKNPGAVLCVDEIEKAHPDVFNLFLQIMEDGILTSSQGEVVSFANILIIMTSNLGMTGSVTPVGFNCSGSTGLPESKNSGTGKSENHAYNIMRKMFKPEFLGRLDDIIMFDRLTAKNISDICKIMLKTVGIRAGKRGIKLSFDKSSVAELVKLGYNKEYGARPLRRVISEKIEDVLADKVLSGELVPGDNICIKFTEQVFVIEKKQRIRRTIRGTNLTVSPL